MSFVATAVVAGGTLVAGGTIATAAIAGAATLGAVSSMNAAETAASAAQSGATTAAQAQILSTQMQVEEIARQYDYQQQILLPQIQQQYNAQGAFADLLGVSGPQLGQNMETGYVPTPRPREEQQAIRDSQIQEYQQSIQSAQAQLNALGPAPQGGWLAALDPNKDLRQQLQNEIDSYQSEIDYVNASPWDEEIIASGNLARGPQFPGPGSTTFSRGSRGEFIDPNLDPTRLADVNTYGNVVRQNLLAGTSAEADPYRRYIDQNQIAAPTAAENAQVARARDVTLTGMRGGDTMEARRGNVLLAPGTIADDQLRQDIASRSAAAGAAGTGVYGEEFTASPGYEFAVEQMTRATDRALSRGGNYGGRAVLEAQRRAEGLANQEYYNWAAGRTQDLQRLAQAEAMDIGRLDTAAYDVQGRRTQDVLRGDTFAAQDVARLDQFAGTDINRGDTALAAYEAQRIADVGRGDTAYQDYLRRREGDVARIDAAAMQEDQLMAADQQRRDQAYYNYLANLQSMAGFGGGPAQTAVSASQAAGAQTANAYAQEGSQLSSIYNTLGQNLGGIRAQGITNQANAITSGIGNWLTYSASQ